ncbi:MAG: glycosyltransferase, partial [Bacteroidales bacterium]|nr:glycosyltransferase [Bacteroidales bacterium]
WKEVSILKKMQDALKYFLFVKMRVFNKIFILNDSASAKYLNKKFNTNKFKFLPDPYVPIGNSDLHNVRNELNIPENKNVYLHFGDLSPQKGTLEILNAIELLSITELDNLCFIFAGRVNKDIKKEFYLKLKTQKKRTHILFFEGFFDYSFLASLCLSCDYMLLPYKRTSQSSGLIGYAAQFNKPVIAPYEKLLGKLIRKYNLGIMIKNLNPLSLASTIKDSNKNLNWVNNSNYIEINNVTNFSNAIFNELI